MTKSIKPSVLRASPSLVAKLTDQGTSDRELPTSVILQIDMTQAMEIVAGKNNEYAQHEMGAVQVETATPRSSVTKVVIPRRKRAPAELKAVTVRVDTELLARVNELQDQLVASERRTVTLQEIVSKSLDAYVVKHLIASDLASS
jgi:hypothetical protein